MPIESNHDELAGRIAKPAAKRGKRVTEKRVGPDWANKEVEGHMADSAMLARTSRLATGSWTSPEKRSSCAPFLVTG